MLSNKLWGSLSNIDSDIANAFAEFNVVTRASRLCLVPGVLYGPTSDPSSVRDELIETSAKATSTFPMLLARSQAVPHRINGARRYAPIN
jgi:hypothetical protein